MMPNSVLISVAMPNYNHAEYLPERIESILNQLGDDGELIIVDDGSTDNSLEILELYSKKSKKLRIIYHPVNLGVISAANRALKEASGEYITFLAVDDVILPGFIDKTLEVLQAHPQMSLCCSDFGYISGKISKNVMTYPLISKATKPVIFKTPEQVVQLFKYNPFGVPGHTSIVKREALLKRGGFRQELESSCDWFLLQSIALEEGFIFLPETLSAMRFLPGSYSDAIGKDKKRKNLTYMNMLKILREKENRVLCKRFMRSSLIEKYVFLILWDVIKRPTYWRFLIEAIASNIYRKYLNFPSNLLKRFRLYPK